MASLCVGKTWNVKERNYTTSNTVAALDDEPWMPLLPGVAGLTRASAARAANGRACHPFPDTKASDASSTPRARSFLPSSTHPLVSAAPSLTFTSPSPRLPPSASYPSHSFLGPDCVCCCWLTLACCRLAPLTAHSRHLHTNLPSIGPYDCTYDLTL
jgi:hypothetical protein